MPELPEVETTRRGIAPHLLGRRLESLQVREARLRWPVEATAIRAAAVGQALQAVARRGKYLLLDFPAGTVMVHLGMSGSLRVLGGAPAPGPHDHVDLCFDGGLTLRLTDPRRFGCVLWARPPAAAHPLLARLGVEPLDPGFDGALLHAAARGRPGPVKQLLMNARVVVGVGNIYASEALYRARIHPRRPARRVSAGRYALLADAVRVVLGEAIEAGGTTLRDFLGGDGRPGYFARRLAVYGREGQACADCGGRIRRELIGQRSTFFCPACQR